MSKKKTSKKSVSRSKSKELVSKADWEKQMATAASAQSARTISSAGNYLSIKGGTFSYQGGDIGEVISVVILDFVYEHTWYDTVYDKKNPSTPACFAIGSEPKGLVPSDQSPAKVDDSCDDCPKYKWGSGKNGKGKGCGDHRRLALVAYEDLENSLDEIEIVMLSVPIMSCKHFDKFAKGVEKALRRPVYGVVCEMSFDEDEDYEVVKFKVQEPMDNMAYAGKILELQKQCQSNLLQEYDPSGYTGGKTARSSKKGKKKTSGKKTASKRAKAKRSKFSR